MPIKDNVCSIKELHRAMLKCRKGVLWKDSVANFIHHGLVRCYKLKHSLLNDTYKISKYIQFQIHEPKTRDIVSTRFVDRVFQRSLCDNYLTHEIQRDFIADNYACQIGKGNDKARLAMIRHLHEHYEQYGTNGYVLKCDIHDYFGSTSHALAKESVEYVIDEWSKKHLHNIIDSFSQGENKDIGMGLGSQVTQSVQLAVLDPLDKLIKHKAYIKHYIRYMDDFYLIHISKEHLNKCLKSIRRYLKSKGLSLNENKTKIQKITQPIHFLGYSYKLKENGKVAMRVLPKNISKNRRKLKKLVIIKGVSRDECDKVLQAILAHVRKSNNRSQINKLVRYYKDLWRNKEMLKEKTLEERVADLEKQLKSTTEFACEQTEKGKKVNRGLKDKGFSKGEELAIMRKAVMRLIAKHGDENDSELAEFVEYYNQVESVKLEVANEENKL